jgi:hypothetical protein
MRISQRWDMYLIALVRRLCCRFFYEGLACPHTRAQLQQMVLSGGMKVDEETVNLGMINETTSI